ncbi:GATA type zinc finger transcription factor family protein [Medicago truncatula]|uniref:GATA type zinc finger transcription factor family protein n=2 Tax=Medicago truncatula TaxID=3880 RepID=G7IIE3_MEDTR|nr:GATA type zinc finger transcription factor family protein [Medicago truncatula]
MIPTYRYSASSPPMPFFDLNNEDHNHHLFTTNQQATSSSSSLSYSILFNQNQDQTNSYSWESNHILSDGVEVKNFVPSSESWDHQEVEKDAKDWKKEEDNENFRDEGRISMKWMPSKKRMIKRMMEDQRASEQEFEKQIKQLSPNLVGTEDSSNNNFSNNSTVRVCTDCHTTKTPLWRSGPTGPKSLCNACGIRQRKARRALAAAANGETLVVAEKPYVKGKKLQIKRKRSKTDQCAQLLKRKGKSENKCNNFEDLITSWSNNLASHQVFPQDVKEAAILLMALSSGLLNGCSSDEC